MNLSRIASCFLLATLFWVTHTTAFGATFDVSVDTSSVVGQNGGIYFGFFPGNNAAAASVSISDFRLTVPGALNGSPFTDGGTSGSLSSTVSIDNSTALNDYLQGLIFGTALRFLVKFNLPSPLSGSSGSELDVQITGGDLQTPLLTKSADGYLVKISYNQAGVFTALSTGSAATITAANATPEPRMLSALGLVVLYFANWWRRQRLTMAKTLVVLELTPRLTSDITGIHLIRSGICSSSRI